MKPRICANPTCSNILTTKQVIENCKHCSMACWYAVKRERDKNSLKAQAERLGVAYTTLSYARKQGRYKNGVIDPPIRSHKAVGDTVTDRARSLGISRPTYYQALSEGRIAPDGTFTPAKRGRPCKKG